MHGVGLFDDDWRDSLWSFYNKPTDICYFCSAYIQSRVLTQTLQTGYQAYYRAE